MGRPTSRRLAPATNEPLLPRAERRARGVYYTPPEIVRELVRLTLGKRLTRRASEGDVRKALRILDPACGAGAMLVEAARQLAGSGRLFSLFGVDSDPQAVASCQDAVAGAKVWTADALFDDRLDRLAPFDAIVGNPPYVNIRQLAKNRPTETVAKLRVRYATARGNFDLYVPFIERAWQLLAPGGRCGFIIPNKWATLDYARPLRELLLAETTIEHVVDLSAVRVFTDASVYPHLLVFTKQPAIRRHVVLCRTWVGPQTGGRGSGGRGSGGRGSCRAEPRPLVGALSRIPQRQFSPGAICFAASLAVESRVETRPLGELANISCGTPGYSAERVAAALLEGAEGVDFITSGNIDRYQFAPGNVRFLGHTYQRPVLPLDSPALTDRQRKLFAGPKIVVAGLSQRLEAAWDDRGLALGVQVFALSEWQIEPQFLLALLNSKLLSYLFRTRFAAKRLAGDYLAINKGQLSQLPIAIPRTTSVPLIQRLGQPGRLSYEDAEIDQLVYRLYRLTKAEIAAVEAHFANLGRRAA